MVRTWWLLAVFVVCVNVWQNSCAASSPDLIKESSHSQSPDEEWVENNSNSTDVDLLLEECLINGHCRMIGKPVPRLELEESRNVRSRSKRRIYGSDNRFYILPRFTRRRPFNSAVAIRLRGGKTSCSGTALTKRLFLTAAHCLLTSTGAIAADLQVGIIGPNGSMKWTQVKKAYYHYIWKWEKKRRQTKRKDYMKYRLDYAVVETVSALDVSTLKIRVLETDNEGKEILQHGKTYMYLFAFDDYLQPAMLRFRYCTMKKITQRKILSHCDTFPKTAGAGVYVQRRNPTTKRIEREIIAIETGDYKKPAEGRVKFSTALRITKRIFGHICLLILKAHGNCMTLMHGT